jgi:enoyl-[acyl-carrier protein] reductase I
VKLLEGKRGVITGIVNHRSIAWHIAKLFREQGAEIAITYGKEGRWIDKLSSQINATSVYQCDVTNQDEMGSVCEKLGDDLKRIDFVVHAIAFADSEELLGGVINTSKKGFLDALEISAYSLIALSNNLSPYLSEGASIISLSYLGAERVCAGYNIMGVAKSALECTSRYLASDLGKNKVRVNVISAGPIRTLAGLGLPNFSEMIEKRASLCPLKCNIEQEDVAKAALYLVSDLSTNITGQTIYVDAGYSIMGTWPESNTHS